MSASVSPARLGSASPEAPRVSHGAGSAPDDPRRTKSLPAAAPGGGSSGSSGAAAPERAAPGSGEGLEAHWSSAIDAATD
jgi:hypothetical protein